MVQGTDRTSDHGGDQERQNESRDKPNSLRMHGAWIPRSNSAIKVLKFCCVRASEDADRGLLSCTDRKFLNGLI
jgi:hypothetical protein